MHEIRQVIPEKDRDIERQVESENIKTKISAGRRTRVETERQIKIQTYRLTRGLTETQKI